MLTKERYAPLLSHNPHVSEVIGSCRARGSARSRSASAASATVDLLDLHGSLRSRALRRLAPGRWRPTPSAWLERACSSPTKRTSIARTIPVAGALLRGRAASWRWSPTAGRPTSSSARRRTGAPASGSSRLDLGQRSAHRGDRARRGARHQALAGRSTGSTLARRITPTGADVAILGGPDDAGLAGWIARLSRPQRGERGRCPRAPGNRSRHPPGRGADLRRHRRHAHGHRRRHAGRRALRPDGRQFGFFPYRAASGVVELALPCRPCSAHGSRPLPARASPLHAADRARSGLRDAGQGLGVSGLA